MTYRRVDGRSYNELRPLKVTFNIYEYAPGSVLFELGKTKILCSVHINPGVPPFLKGTGTGWLTAEYALLPASTHFRTQRDGTGARLNGRSVEISRLIGRSIRSVVDLATIGERTIVIDCDVLQADGGTRTASITGTYLALRQAENYWLDKGIIKKPIVKEALVAISAGMVDGQPLLDLNVEEDNKADIDLNFVLTTSHKLVELQGTAEGKPVDWKDFDAIRTVVEKGVNDIAKFFDTLVLP